MGWHRRQELILWKTASWFLVFFTDKHLVILFSFPSSKLFSFFINMISSVWNQHTGSGVLGSWLIDMSGWGVFHSLMCPIHPYPVEFLIMLGGQSNFNSNHLGASIFLCYLDSHPLSQWYFSSNSFHCPNFLPFSTPCPYLSLYILIHHSSFFLFSPSCSTLPFPSFSSPLNPLTT